MECFCNLRNIENLLSDGKTPYDRRFGEPFRGPTIHCVSMVEYHLSMVKICRDCISSKRSLARDILRLCIMCGWNLERRQYGRRD